MDKDKIKKDLTCTRCGKIVETYSEIVFSRGYGVCRDCKKVTQFGDNAAFDRDMDLRRWNYSEEE